MHVPAVHLQLGHTSALEPSFLLCNQSVHEADRQTGSEGCVQNEVAREGPKPI